MKLKFLSLIVIPLVMSCATHSGTISTTHINTNTIFEDIATGTCKSKYFLGMGGLNHNTMINTAKQELYKNRPLKKDESYANFSVDIKQTNYIILFEHMVTVSADIVREVPTSPEQRFSSNYNKKEESPYGNLFKIGDKVLDTSFNEGEIIILNKNKALVKYADNSQKFKKLSTIYTKNNTHNGVKIGTIFSDGPHQGKVIAVGVKKIVISDHKSILHTVYYKPT